MHYHQTVVVEHRVHEIVVEYQEGFLEGVDNIPLLTVQYFDNGGEKVVDTASVAVPRSNPTVLEMNIIVEVRSTI